MTAWYQVNPRLYRTEHAAVEASQPGLSLEVRPAGFRINTVCCLKHEHAVAAGVYTFKGDETGYYDYRIAVVFPSNYPASPCGLYCNDARLPISNVDRHILSDGQACLAVPGELRQRWRYADGIVGFLEEFVSPFLAWQVYYDAHGLPPPWGQRAHGLQGIVEFYAEALSIPAEPSIVAFIPLVARRNHPKGHEPCPCGSGLRLRHCHFAALREARSRISWQVAQHDLFAATRITESRRNGGQPDSHAASKPSGSAEALSMSTTTAAGEG